MQLLLTSAAPSNIGQGGDTIIQTQNCVSPCATMFIIMQLRENLRSECGWCQRQLLWRCRHGARAGRGYQHPHRVGCEKGQQLACHRYEETHVAQYPWRVREMTIESVFLHPKQLNGQRDQSQTGKVTQVTQILTKICHERGFAETFRDGSISTNEENDSPFSLLFCLRPRDHLIGSQV